LIEGSERTSVAELVDRFCAGDRSALARVITLVENCSSQGYEIYRQVYNREKTAYRVGVTGPIGVGKSTLVGKLAKSMRAHGRRVGIVAIDPTSPFTKGAVLGDRIRMADLALDDDVFMRSMASRGNTGGLSRAARMVVDVLEAFGKDVVIVETVGAGQSDLDILDSVDTSIVVLMPNMGDQIQLMKAGLMEIADVFVVNKADEHGADKCVDDLEYFLNMVKDQSDGVWRPPVLKTQAHKAIGVEDVYNAVCEHYSELDEKGLLADKKKRRLEKEVRDLFLEDMEKVVWDSLGMEQRIAVSVDRIITAESDPLGEAEKLVKEIAGSF